MAVYSILTTQGISVQDGSILKLGSGKLSRDALGIAKQHYTITHLSSGLALSSCYRYLSQAKVIANQILTLVGENLLSPEINLEAFSSALQIYMLYSWGNNKTPPTLEEWTNGPDYEEAIRLQTINQGILGGQAPKYITELLKGDCSIAWFPSHSGNIHGEQLSAIIEGRPYNS